MSIKTFKISGMHCSSCSLMLEGGLEDMGVKAKADYKKGIIEILENIDNISDKIIISVVEKEGYSVKD